MSASLIACIVGSTTAAGANASGSTVAHGNIPTVASLSPTSGSTSGGTSVTLTGTGFAGATKVLFGTTPAASFTINGSTSITAVTPAEDVGQVSVSVTTPSGSNTPVFDEEYNNLNNWLPNEPWQSSPGYLMNAGTWAPIPPASLASANSGTLALTSDTLCALSGTGARICGVEENTRSSYSSFVNGYVEGKFRVPNNHQGWPAFWMLGNGTGTIDASTGAGGWPQTGEIDIFEFFNNGSSQAGTPFITVHWNCTNSVSTPNKCQYSPSTNVLANYSAAYHIYGMLRGASTLTFYLDGISVATITKAQLDSVGSAYTYNNDEVIFTNPMHFRTTMASGGNVVGNVAYDGNNVPSAGTLNAIYIRAWPGVASVAQVATYIFK
jgi:hypothetical protein